MHTLYAMLHIVQFVFMQATGPSSPVDLQLLCYEVLIKINGLDCEIN